MYKLIAITRTLKVQDEPLVDTKHKLFTFEGDTADNAKSQAHKFFTDYYYGGDWWELIRNKRDLKDGSLLLKTKFDAIYYLFGEDDIEEECGVIFASQFDSNGELVPCNLMIMNDDEVKAYNEKLVEEAKKEIYASFHSSIELTGEREKKFVEGLNKINAMFKSTPKKGDK